MPMRVANVAALGRGGSFALKFAKPNRRGAMALSLFNTVASDHMTSCAVLRHRTPAGGRPARQLFRSSRKQSERFVEVTKWTEALRWKRAASGGSASAQAVTRMNAEQASRTSMRRPPRRSHGQGCLQPVPPVGANENSRLSPLGDWRRAFTRRGVDATREALSVARTRHP